MKSPRNGASGKRKTLYDGHINSPASRPSVKGCCPDRKRSRRSSLVMEEGPLPRPGRVGPVRSSICRSYCVRSASQSTGSIPTNIRYLIKPTRMSQAADRTPENRLVLLGHHATQRWRHACLFERDEGSVAGCGNDLKIGRKVH